MLNKHRNYLECYVLLLICLPHVFANVNCIITIWDRAAASWLGRLKECLKKCMNFIFHEKQRPHEAPLYLDILYV